ncbi:MAG TPA: aminotransferase class V-fold PLP-dependent enzyme [Planctomycetota bacterium]|nr:aminotransferase class V-fold PLP-dependent enzyme [Planctomycetota bacterium]
MNDAPGRGPTRRVFLGALGAAGVASKAGCARAAGSVEETGADEDFWSDVARAFDVDRSLVNLDNGAGSPTPAVVREAMRRRLSECDARPPSLMLHGALQPEIEAVRARLAAAFGADREELAITRNSSESLQICQFGIDLRRGDEILTSTQDYPRMIAAFRQRERREGVVLRQVKLPVPAEDPAEIVALYARAITPATRLLLVCHMVNLTGQVLPVKEIVAMARARGVPTIVDGAHALAHLDFRIRDLDCDYYGVSLHKWLAAPPGTGLLYVRREKIAGLWPLMAAPPGMDGDIRKFEETGTQSLAHKISIAEAVDFHLAVGGARKAARLVELRDRWARRLLAASERIRLHTSLKPGLAGGMATFVVKGVDTRRLRAWLLDRHRILTQAIVHEDVVGLRVSPSVYTAPEEIDRFSAAIEHVLARGLPG